jgi:tetratricopeptide (TPR) repeat protein
LVRSRPAQLSSAQLPPRREQDVLSSTAAPSVPPVPPVASLHISVVNGDLTYVRGPLLIGHYRSSRLSGAEAVLNRTLSKAMSASLQRGLYPSAPGTHKVFLNVADSFDNPWQPARPEVVIVAGLGPEGELRGSELVNTVRLAVIEWAQRLTEGRPVPATFTLETTLLGSGGSGITAGQAAQLIAQGVREANELLAEDGANPPRWPRVDHLTIIELYLDRASEAWNALQVLAASAPALYTVAKTIERRTGALRRPAEAGYRGADYDFISALAFKREDGNSEVRYVVDSKRARNEVRPQPMQLQLIGNLVKAAANNINTDQQIGRTLFSLLVPADIESFLGGSTETVLELNEGTAGIPWEILESGTGSKGYKPWSIRTKLLRKLQTEVPTIVVNNASADDRILVIGDPDCKREIYPRLMGARREASDVAKFLTDAISKSPDGKQSASNPVEALISGENAGEPDPPANKVLDAVFQESWRIIHVAGHGEPPDEVARKSRGVVLSGDSFFGPIEIKALRVKPELVFVNCCHLAASDSRELLQPYNRAQFAAGVAQALIESGVRCVIAAGWAVDDHAASEFAKAFYGALLKGARFIDAVAAARASAHDCGGNTWAAYQCYGDPDWQFRVATGDAQSPTPPPPRLEFAGIASAPSLILALDEIAIKSEYQPQGSNAQIVRLRYLEANFAECWNRGDVAEAFGNAWSKSENFERAVYWYERARDAGDGTASLAAVEQLANARIRLAWRRVADDPDRSEAKIQKARNDIDVAMASIDTLLKLRPTRERESLIASGFKRLAMVEGATGEAGREQSAIKEMLKRYTKAEEIAVANKSAFFYPAMNRFAAQLALGLPVNDDDVAAVRGSMSTGLPDFWSVVGQTELNAYVSIRDRSLARDVNGLVAEFKRHHARVDNPRMWGSIFDNATFLLAWYRRNGQDGEASAADTLLDALKELTSRTQADPGNSVAETQSSARAMESVGKPRRSAAKGAARKKRVGKRAARKDSRKRRLS